MGLAAGFVAAAQPGLVLAATAGWGALLKVRTAVAPAEIRWAPGCSAPAEGAAGRLETAAGHPAMSPRKSAALLLNHNWQEQK